MIKYKGFQVAPSELEDMLLTHPAVKDAAVCATYDPAQATEIPLAYVSLVEPEANNLDPVRKQALLDSIRAWMDSRVAGPKKLRGGVRHLQDLPKTASGKILRRNLPAVLKGGRLGKL
jgi:acyl-coenzyme A synthetase/AMP-(fatty) acid ligase